jgi:hypothetical protein
MAEDFGLTMIKKQQNYTVIQVEPFQTFKTLTDESNQPAPSTEGEGAVEL